MKDWPWWGLVTLLFMLAGVTGRGLLAVLGAILALAGLSSAIWYRYCLDALDHRHYLANRWLSFGEETELRIECTNNKPLPLAWLVIRDRFPSQMELLTGDLRSGPPDQPSWLVSVLALRWYERVRRIHRIRGTERGVFQIGPAELSSGDVFGTRRRTLPAPDRTTVTVYPPVVSLEDLGLPANHPIGELLAQRKVLADPLRFASLRDYVRGDNPRHIHWKASAHADSLQTKVFEETDSRNLILAIDVQTRDATYESTPAYLELLICTAASIAAVALSQQSMVGVCANNTTSQGTGWTYLPPGRHPEQFSQIQDHLAAITTFRGVPFPQMLDELLRQVPFGSTIALFTSRPTEETLAAITTLEANGHQTMILCARDTLPTIPDPFLYHHLGGRRAWQEIKTLALQ